MIPLAERTCFSQVTKCLYDALLAGAATRGEAGLRALTSRDICVLSPYNRHKNRLRTVTVGIK